MDPTLIGQVRRFHRTVTQRVGALYDEYLSRGRPLGQSRVLWEIGEHGCEVRALRDRLDLDSGYLSRVLRALANDGLIQLSADGADGRVRRVRLTDAGRAEVDLLDRRSDELAAEILRPLNDRQRERLVAAMSEVDLLLTASTVEVEIVDPHDSKARFCLDSYVEELARRFEGGFDPGRSISADDDEISPPNGAMLVASLHGEPVACGALKLHAEGSAELKRMWVAPDARGLGLGRRMLRELETYAAARGATRARLETNRALDEAIALYRSFGYREVEPFNDEPYAHHWFEKILEPQLPKGSHT